MGGVVLFVKNVAFLGTNNKKSVLQKTMICNTL